MSSETLLQAHNQWAFRPQDQRFQSLDALAAAVGARRLRSRAVDIETQRTEVKSDGRILTINGQITPCEPTHYAFGQLSTLVGAPASYLRKLPHPLLVQNLNHGLQNGDRAEVKFMTIASEESEINTLQAVTSKTYGRIWDADCVAACQRIVERTGGKFYNPKAYNRQTGTPEPSGLYASDRDVFMFLIDGGSLLDAGPRAQLNRGWFMWNSEVGARTFGLTTFLFNVCCGNHYVMGAQNVQSIVIRHTCNGPARFDSEAAPALLDYANASAAPLEAQIRRAQGYSLIKDATPDKRDEAITEFANKHGKFSRSEIREAINTAKMEEGQCATLWDLCQGFTAYARGFEYVDARVDLETRASKLLELAKN